MTHIISQSDDLDGYADQLADYLNGHLSPENRQRIETALSESNELREQLAFERRLQGALRAEAAEFDAVADAQGNGAADQGFAAIADRLKGAPPAATQSTHDSLTRRLQRWLNNDWRWLFVPAAAAAFALAVVLPAQLPSGSQSSEPFVVNEFETRSDTPESFNRPTLRINTRGAVVAADLAALLDRHNLRLTQEYAGGSLFDVTPLSLSVDLDELAARLQEDEQVRLVKVMGSN